MNFSNFLFLITIVTFLCAETSNHALARNADSTRRSSKPTDISAIKKEFMSKDPAIHDRALCSISLLITTAHESDRNHETLLRLVKDKDIVNTASEILNDRLTGWYEERNLDKERSMYFYYPLIYLLSISEDNVAGITLLMALPMLGFDPYFRKSIYYNEMVLKHLFSKIKALENKLCCFYPGRDLVSDMLVIDSRITTLKIYLEALNKNTLDTVRNLSAIKKFILDCLEFGDEKKGRIIRTLGMELAEIFINAGHKDFLPVLNKISKSDPYYLYELHDEYPKNDSLFQYDLARKYFPVREKAITVIKRVH